MICRVCQSPLETTTLAYDGTPILQDCINPACVQARREELRAPPPAPAAPLLVPACLPGLCEPYRYTPPGAPPLCRHCGAVVPREETTP